MDASPEIPVIPVKVDMEAGAIPLVRTHTFGAVRHWNVEDNELELVPKPSLDPNDPLTWNQRYKYYIVAVVCLAIFICNVITAGPSIAIVQISKTFFPDWRQTGLSQAISQTSYCFTVPSLMQGTSNIVWMPLVNKYGRRPVYLLSFTVYLAAVIWSAFATNYDSFLAARVFTGFGSGAAETIAPSSIADIFFLHERGAMMGWYTAALSIGVGGGIIIDGLITIDHSWRYIFYVAIALVGGTLLILLLSYPETVYLRPLVVVSETSCSDDEKLSTVKKEVHVETTTPEKKSYVQRHHILTGTYTEEPLHRLILRPIALILLPPVLWGALVMSVTIGFLVAVTSNVSSAYSSAYGFESWQTGLCFIAAVIGSLAGIPVGGHLGDWIADYSAKRNDGIREPEMRLPAICVSIITMPACLLLYGAGIEYKLHWIVPTIGLGLLNFSITQATNISLTYTIDSYRPIAGEITLTSMAFKSAFGFLLSFYTNPWIDKDGYIAAYGIMAGLSAFVLCLWVPFYVWGKRIRIHTWQWKVCKYIHWSDDREVGE